eukprot:95829_1
MSLITRAHYEWNDLGTYLGCITCDKTFKKSMNDGGLGKHKKSCISKEIKKNPFLDNWIKSKPSNSNNSNQAPKNQAAKNQPKNQPPPNQDSQNLNQAPNNKDPNNSNVFKANIQCVEAEVACNGGLKTGWTKSLINATRCCGVLPTCFINKIDRNNFLRFVPTYRTDLQKICFVSQTGIHDTKCPLVLYDEQKTNTDTTYPVNKMCWKLRDNVKINNMFSVANRLKQTSKNTQLSSCGLKQKTQTQADLLQKEAARIQALEKNVLNKCIKITIHRRIFVAAASSKRDGMSNIFEQYMHAGKSANWLREKMDLYVTDCLAYNPHKKEEDKCRAALIMALSGPKLLKSLYRSGVLVSTDVAKQKMFELQSDKIIYGSTGISYSGLYDRLTEIVEGGHWSPNEPIGIGTTHGDELHINRKLEVNLSTHEVPSQCMEHYNINIHINIANSERTAKLIMRQIGSG